MAISEKRRQENRERFIRVVHGGGGSNQRGRKENKGRLPMLRDAFQNLAEVTRTDHYEFDQGQAIDVLAAVDVEVRELREAFLKNVKAG
jgi:hypothetical protein